MWLKTRCGEPIYDLLPRNTVIARCPQIPAGAVPANQKHIFPLREFQARFRGRFKTGLGANEFSTEVNPHHMMFGFEVDDVLLIFCECYGDYRDVEGNHSCGRCQFHNPTTGVTFSVYCGDGVAINHHCCSHGNTEVEACHDHPQKTSDKCCPTHKAEETLCEVNVCDGFKNPPMETCGQDLCVQIFEHWLNTKYTVSARIRRQLQPVGALGRERTRVNFRNAQLPAAIKAALNEIATGALHVNSIHELMVILFSVLIIC